MPGERLDTWCEKGILVLTLAALIFGPLATGAVRTLEFLVIQTLTVCALLLWLARLWLNPTLRLFWPPIAWAVLAFVGYAIFRYLHADIEYAARQELIRILVYAILFFVILNNLNRQGSAELFACALIFLGMAVSIYAIYQFATNSDRVWHFVKPPQYLKRGSGTYICPNHLAGFLEMLLPLGLAYALSGRVGHLLRVFLAYASVLILSGIGVSLSRGGWMATGLSLLVFFTLLIRRRQYRWPALIVLVALVAAAGVFYSKARTSQERIDRMFAADNPETAGSRFQLWTPALKMWQDHLWWGVGPAHFDHRFPAYRPPEIQARPGFVHNDYLNLLADWGLIGTAFVAAAWALLASGVLKTWRFVRRDQSDLGTKPSNRSAFVFGASLGLLAILIHSFTDFNMHVPANAMLAVALIALLSSHLRFTSERYWINRNGAVLILVTIAGLAGAAYVGWQGATRAREYVWLQRAAGEKTYSEKLVNMLKQAAAVEPKNFETTYAIGEALRRMSWEGNPDYERLAREAITWFKTGIDLTRYDPYNYMKLGMCLDWLGRSGEAAPYFEQSLRLDPNNYYVVAHYGWHFFQIGDYTTARQWFTRSTELHHAWKNQIARTYLELIERKLKEAAAPK